MKTDQPPYLTKTITCYNPHFGNDRVCKCGHKYYRHFDSYENNEPVGCKYCQCRIFDEAAVDRDKMLTVTVDDVQRTSTPFLGLVHINTEQGSGILGTVFPKEYLLELGLAAMQLKTRIAEFPEFSHHIELFESFITICKDSDAL